MKIFEKMPFRRPKNDEPPTESSMLTHFQSKSYINLCEFEFRRKIKRPSKRKFFKKCYFGGRNDGIWPKNDELFAESCSLTHFQLKSCTKLCEFEFRCKIKQAPKQKFLKKNAILEVERWNLADKR